MKKVLALFLLSSIFLLIYWNISSQNKKTNTTIDNPYTIQERAMGDFNGDGEYELAVAYSQETFFTNSTPYAGHISIYDKGGWEIARTLKGFTPQWGTLPGHMEAYQLDKKNKKEYLRLRTVAGPHQFMDLFMQIVDNTLVPICKSGQDINLDSCTIYNTSFGATGDQQIQDLDNDGVTEVIEVVDEYPPGGDRGRYVLNNIYHINDTLFDLVTPDEYEKYYMLLSKTYQKGTFIRNSQWSKESKENFTFIKNAWQDMSNK